MVKIVFKKGRTFISLLIRLITRSKFSHVGIVIDDIIYETDIGYNFRKSKFDWEESIYNGIILDISNEEKDDLIKYLNSNIGKKYDNKENLRYILKLFNLDWIFKDNNRKWNCVESVVDSLHMVEKYKHISESETYSPNDLYNMIKNIT